MQNKSTLFLKFVQNLQKISVSKPHKRRIYTNAREAFLC